MMKFITGYSDFREIIKSNIVFVDKSLLIKDILDDAKTVLITRPRRFGKTLNLSMLNYFFNLPELIIGDGDPKHLFQGLAINNEKEYLTHQNQYPVIFITLKDVKESNQAAAYNKIFELVVEMFGLHAYLLKSDRLSPDQKDLFEIIISRRANQQQIENGLLTLSKFLYAYHQKQVIILIDEYDTPIQSGYFYGFSKEIIAFMRNFFGAGLKDNIFIKKAVLTGILRIAKENLFSGLNNIETYSLLQNRYSQYFGFTENEVSQLLTQADLNNNAKEIRDWYNGYCFGKTTIYNPWSIVSCLSKGGQLRPYWVNTSGNELIKEEMAKASPDFKIQFELLLQGRTISQMINESFVFSDLQVSEETIWSLLLFSGYLKALNAEAGEDEIEYECTLAIPNQEVSRLYKSLVRKWFIDKLGSLHYQHFLADLLNGRMDDFSQALQRYLFETASFFDVNGHYPEKFYHGFVLGLVASLGKTHQIKSNRESGYGRYDVMIIPKDKTQLGIIMEFKRVEDEDQDLKLMAEDALKQVRSRGYEAELKQQDISKILSIGMAFCGKKVKVAY